MHNKRLKLFILNLLLVTAGLLLWHKYGMNLNIEVNPKSAYPIKVNDDRWEGGASEVSLDRTSDAIIMKCKLKKQYNWPYCEAIITISDEPNGIDMSNFDYVLLDIETKGNGNGDQGVKVYLRHFDSAYSEVGDHDSLKVNEIRYIPNESERPLQLSTNHFMVASWWVLAENIRPENAAPDISNIVTIEIATDDSMTEGEYEIIIHSIRLHGKLLNLQQILILILGVWILSAIYYLVASLWYFQQALKAMHTKQQQLEQINSALEIERRGLENMATHDALTGAYNRVGLRNQLYEKIYQVKQNIAPLSAMFIDIDNYKEINDQYGHEAGDEILKSFVSFIIGHTRNDDVLCRWGGDEFILFCHDIESDLCVRLAEKLRISIANHIWFKNIKFTCSFGVSEMIPNEDIAHFINRVDQELYCAKGNGRNCVMPTLNMRGRVK